MSETFIKPLWKVHELEQFVELQIREWSLLSDKTSLSHAIESIRTEFQFFVEKNPEAIQSLNTFRIRGSHSLTMPEATKNNLENWVHANLWISDKSLSKLFEMESIFHLNSIILGTSKKTTFRDQSAFLLGDEILAARDISQAMLLIHDRIIPFTLSAKESLDQIFGISLFVQIFTMIHPFKNGNGRTCRLLAEAFLIEKGFPLLSFFEHSDSYVLVQNLHRLSDRSLMSHIAAMERSLLIMQNLAKTNSNF